MTAPAVTSPYFPHLAHRDPKLAMPVTRVATLFVQNPSAMGPFIPLPEPAQPGKALHDELARLPRERDTAKAVFKAAKNAPLDSPRGTDGRAERDTAAALAKRPADDIVLVATRRIEESRSSAKPVAAPSAWRALEAKKLSAELDAVQKAARAGQVAHAIAKLRRASDGIVVPEQATACTSTPSIAPKARTPNPRHQPSRPALQQKLNLEPSATPRCVRTAARDTRGCAKLTHRGRTRPGHYHPTRFTAR
jgi:hypothetical protein